MFESELQMHNFFGQFIEKKICDKQIDYDIEVKNLYGIPDYVIFEKTEKNLKYIIGIELKLKDWKQGIIQAFRYKNFSNDVYVILDNNFINPAIKKIEEFKKYNVGLASFDKEYNFKIHYVPLPEKPSSKFYTKNLRIELEKKQKIAPTKIVLNFLEKKESKKLIKKLKSNGI